MGNLHRSQTKSGVYDDMASSIFCFHYRYMNIPNLWVYFLGEYNLTANLRSGYLAILRKFLFEITERSRWFYIGRRYNFLAVRCNGATWLFQCIAMNFQNAWIMYHKINTPSGLNNQRSSSAWIWFGLDRLDPSPLRSSLVYNTWRLISRDV